MKYTHAQVYTYVHGLLHLHSVVFCLCFVYCMIVLFVDNLFLYLGGQSVSCKASLAALRLYGYFCDIVVMMLLSENKYDDDDDIRRTTLFTCARILPLGVQASYDTVLYTKQNSIQHYDGRCQKLCKRSCISIS